MKNFSHKIIIGTRIFFIVSVIFLTTVLYAIVHLPGFIHFLIHIVFIPLLVFALAALLTVLFYPSIVRWMALKAVEDDEEE